MDYKSAGVDIDAGNLSEDLIASAVKKTYNPQVISGVGGFGAIFSLSKVRGMKNPMLVSTVDGVGTKLKVAAMMDKWDTVGADIVNHCSNDVLCMGAKPLFFMDYLAAAKIDPHRVEKIVSGMADACAQLDCPLIGGETAEMPGVYYENEADVVGCMVGVVEKSRVLDGSKIRRGDALIGLASNGLHTNGYSLARKVLFDKAGLRVTDVMPELGQNIGSALLAVHKTYSTNVLALADKINLHGVCHITGGGLAENLPRIMPKSMRAGLDYSSIELPDIFRLIKRMGNISDEDMFHTFNMGVGMVLVVAEKDASKTIKFMKARDEKAWIIGHVISNR